MDRGGHHITMCVYALKIRHEEPYFDNQTPLCKERTARRNDVYSTHYIRGGYNQIGMRMIAGPKTH